MDASGGTGNLSVTTTPDCEWSASTSANWISGLSPASGQGSGTVEFRVAANDGAAARDGAIVINGRSVMVSQRASCRYTVTPANQNATANGGAGSVSVTTTSDCAWTVSTDVSWIALSPPLSGSGSGTVAFTVDRNTGASRTGSITIQGQRATVTQAAASSGSPCAATIAPTGQSFGAAGGPGATITVTASNACSWTAVSSASWIVVTSGASGNGNGTVTFNVSANTGAARDATMTIAGQVFSVTQSASGAPPPPPSCTYSIAPASQNVAAAGGQGSATVTANAGCAWTAVSSAAWVIVTSGAAGAGNGSVAFTVAANTGAARSATLTIAGHTFPVTQDAAAAPPPPLPCAYSIAPAGQNVDANANTGTVTVTAGAACAWTAASNAAWLTVTSGATGTGNGSVGFSVAANAGAERTGTLTVAGQTFTVTQAAAAPPPPPPPPCAYSIAPNSQNFLVIGGAGTVMVTTTAACAWTASSGAAWVTITAGVSGTGNGIVAFAVVVNIGGQRTGTLTIAGQSFTVTQDGVLPLVREP
jgi:hypothetical protein